MTSLDSVREQFLGALFARLAAASAKDNKSNIILGACAFTIVTSLMLGGGTRGGFLSDAVLELLAVPGFLISVATLAELTWRNSEIERRAHWVLAFCFAIAFVPLFQLLPLPPFIWTRLPGHETVTAVMGLLGGQQLWMTISVSPSSTWLSVLSLLPPFAIFLGVIQLRYRERRWLSLIVIAFGVVSVFVGLIQLNQGPTSPLRFFQFTNVEDAVGLFANRNHFAALLYAGLVFAAAWAISAATGIASWSELRRVDPRTTVALAACALVIIVLIVGEIVARSRAGYLLALAALGGAFALAFAGSSAVTAISRSKIVVAAVALVIILVIQIGLYRTFDRFTSDPLADARIPFAHNTIQAALTFMPFGSGTGTFVPVYATVERPSDTFANVYANHAHNDFLELWLESGVMGMTLLALFVAWMGIKVVRIWRNAPANAGELDWLLIRAATIVVALLLAHSSVDYPLRTGAMMAVLAFSCALLVEPLRPPEDERRIARQSVQPEVAKPKEAAIGAGRSQARQPPSSQSTKPLAKPVVPRGGGRWGEGIEWPDEWRKSNAMKDKQEG